MFAKNTKSRRGDPVWSPENSQFTIKIVGQGLAPTVVLLNNPYTIELSSTAPKPLRLVTFVACDKSNQKHAFGCARRAAVALNFSLTIVQQRTI